MNWSLNSLTRRMSSKKTTLTRYHHRCQHFGYTKHYCSYQVRCVKCDGSHSTDTCRVLKPKIDNITGHYIQNSNLKLIIKQAYTHNPNVKSKKNNVQVSIGNTSSSNSANMFGHTSNYANALNNLNLNDTLENNNNISNINDLTK